MLRVTLATPVEPFAHAKPLGTAPHVRAGVRQVRRNGVAAEESVPDLESAASGGFAAPFLQLLRGV